MRILRKETLTVMQNLVRNMNKQTQYVTNGFTFDSKILTGLKSDTVKFFDQSYKVAPVEELAKAKSKIEFGKVSLVIDNITGQIEQFQKPFWKSWKKIMQKVDEKICFFHDNMDNSKKVEKRFLNIQGFTEKGVEKLQNLEKVK